MPFMSKFRYLTDQLIRQCRYQPKCETCLRTPFDHFDPKTFRLTPCDDCKLAFFCTPKCRTGGIKQHQQKQYSILKDAGASEIANINYVKETGDPMIQMPSEAPSHTYRPLHAARSWKAYFEDLADNPFARYIKEDFSPADDDEVSLRACRFLKVAVDASSFILTILGGLESEIPNIASRTELTLHIIGADWEAIARARMTEELNHLLPNLQRLIIGYLGPDVGRSGGNAIELVGLECCPNCQKMGRTPR